MAAGKLDMGWKGSHRFMAGTVGVLAAVSLLTPVVPFWLALWVVVTTVVHLWPTPSSERYRPLTKPFTRCISVYSIRKHCWHPFSWHPWRLGAEGDNDGDFGNPLEEHPEEQAKMRAYRRKKAGVEAPPKAEKPKRDLFRFFRRSGSGDQPKDEKPKRRRRREREADSEPEHHEAEADEHSRDDDYKRLLERRRRSYSDPPEEPEPAAEEHEEPPLKRRRFRLGRSRKDEEHEPDGEHEHHDEMGAAEPKQRTRVIAVNSLSAALLAVASVGIEQVIAVGVSYLDWAAITGGSARLEPLANWLGQGRAVWLQALAVPMGWAAAKSVASWQRMHAAAKLNAGDELEWEKPKASLPTAIAVNPYADPESTTLFRALLKVRSLLFIALGVGVAAGAAFLLSQGSPLWLAPLMLALVPVGLLVGGRMALLPWMKEQWQPWIEWQTLVNKWAEHWTEVIGGNKAPPSLVSYMLRPLQRKDEEPMPPMVRQLVFALDVGVAYKTVQGRADELKAAVECDLMHIMPGVDPGTREPTWSYVDIRHELPALGEWAEERKGRWEDWAYPWGVNVDRQTAYHDPDLHQDVRAFLFHRQLGRAMEHLKIGTLLVLRAPSLRSDEGAFPAYLRFEVPLHGKTTFNALQEKQHQLAAEMRSDWLRFEPLTANNIAIGHICAVRPDEKVIEGIFSDRQAAKLAMRDVMRLDWHWCMHTAKLFGDDGTSTPTLDRIKIVNRKREDPDAAIHQITFSLPQGLSAEDVQRQSDQLAADSNFPYVSVETTELPSKVVVLAGKKDPLDDSYLFDDYADKEIFNGEPMLKKPVAGEPRIEWFVGVGTDGGPMLWEWDHEEAHALIAGSTGSGKSMVVNSMLVQLLTNNDPSDLELWLLEPKNELGRYASKPHCRVFIDQHVAEGSIYEVASLTFAALCEEMERRYALMDMHPKKPQKISEARLIGRSDPEYAHLNFRYIICVVEECASYFRKPGSGDKEHLASHRSMMGRVIELAQKARAAGIHLVFATQNPTADAIQMPIKSNTRRIGLRVNKLDRSMVIIDQPGLEKISKPGRGMMTGPNGDYTGYRAFFLRGEEDAAESDLGRHLSKIPDDDRWPKLPPGVEPSVNREVALEPQIN